MNFYGKSEKSGNENVKKPFVLISKMPQQQEGHFAGPCYSLGQSDVFEFDMLNCPLFLRK